MSVRDDFDIVFGSDNKEVDDFMTLGQGIIDLSTSSEYSSIEECIEDSMTLTPEERFARIEENLAGFAEFREVWTIENITESLSIDGREPDPRIVAIATSIIADLDALEDISKAIKDNPQCTDAELVENTGFNANDVLTLVNGMMKKIVIYNTYAERINREMEDDI